MSTRSSHWGLVALLYAAGLGAAAQFAKLASGFTALEAAYPQAGSGLGLAVSLISFLGVALGLVAGMIVARLGFRTMLLAGLLLGAAMSLLQASLPPLPLFMASRLVEGASHLAIVVAAPTLIAEVTRDADRPVAMALWSTFFGTGFALFAGLGTPLAASHGAGAPILMQAGWMLAVALGVARMIPRRLIAAPAEPFTLRLILRRHAQVYRSPAMAAPALGWLCYTLTFVSALTLLPRLAPGAPWLATVLPLTGIALSLTVVAQLLRVVPAVRVVIAGFALAAGVVALLALAPGAAALWIALFGVLSLVQAGSFAAIPQLVAEPRDRALSNGAVAQMGNLGNLAGTPVLMAALTLGGQGAGLAFLGISYAAGLALHLGLSVLRNRSADPA
jgi:MFS family permease